MAAITMKPEDQIEQAGPVDDVVSKMYADLKRLARGQMRGERRGHTLQTSALVHEAYLRLVRSGHADHIAGGELLAIASHLMRQVLVDHARKVRAAKRGGPSIRVELADCGVAPSATPEVLALHEALDELAKCDPRKAQIIEMRYFGGLER
jgi:RNA polymerase sigma factor (TIGR02999 family)